MLSYSSILVARAKIKLRKFCVVQVVLLWRRYRSITGLYKGAGSVQRAGDSEVNMKVVLHW